MKFLSSGAKFSASDDKNYAKTGLELIKNEPETLKTATARCVTAVRFQRNPHKIFRDLTFFPYRKESCRKIAHRGFGRRFTALFA
jgi:hypothetical protein